MRCVHEARNANRRDVRTNDSADHPLLLRRFASTCVMGEDYSLPPEHPVATYRLGSESATLIREWARHCRIPLRDRSFVIEDYLNPGTYVVRTYAYCPLDASLA